MREAVPKFSAHSTRWILCSNITAKLTASENSQNVPCVSIKNRGKSNNCLFFIHKINFHSIFLEFEKHKLCSEVKKNRKTNKSVSNLIYSSFNCFSCIERARDRELAAVVGESEIEQVNVQRL